MENNQSKMKIILPIVVIIGVLLIGGGMYVFANTTEVLLAKLINNAGEPFEGMFEVEGNELDLIYTKSHNSETNIEVDVPLYGVNAVMDIFTGYLNSTGDLAVEINAGLNGIEGLDLSHYLVGSEWSMSSSFLSKIYTIDLEKGHNTDKARTLFERIQELSNNNAEEIIEFENRIEKKSKEYSKFAAKNLPKDSLSKGNGELEILGETANEKYIELSFDDASMKEWLRVILEKANSDEELKLLLKEFMETALENNEYSLSDLGIDFDKVFEYALADLDNANFGNIKFRIYYEGHTPLAYEIVSNQDGEEVNILIKTVNKSGNHQLYMGAKSSTVEVFINYTANEDGFLVDGDFDGILVYLKGDKTKDSLALTGKVKVMTGEEYLLTSKIDYTKEGKDFNFKVTAPINMSVAQITGKGTIKEGPNGELKYEIVFNQDGIDLLMMKADFEKEEISKEKEYDINGTITLSSPSLGGNLLKLNLNNKTVYGDDVKVDVPSLEGAYKVKISDEAGLQSLVEELGREIEDLLFFLN